MGVLASVWVGVGVVVAVGVGMGVGMGIDEGMVVRESEFSTEHLRASAGCKANA